MLRLPNCLKVIFGNTKILDSINLETAVFRISIPSDIILKIKKKPAVISKT
jgi:hypothetical protein